MGIDSGQALVFSAGFPLPNVDQSSQQFRDNFSIIKTAIERLQTTHSDNSSVVALTATMSGADVLLTASYKDGGLVLPSGTPGTAVSGMIRYANSTVEFYNSSGWHPVVFVAANGVASVSRMSVPTNLTLGYTPLAPTDAVPLSYVTGQFSIANATLASQQSQITGEQTARANAVTNLQSQIDGVYVNQQALSDLGNTVGQFDGRITNAVSEAGNAIAAANAVATGLAQEILDRVASDLNNANAIAINANAIANSATSSDLAAEANTRATADSGLDTRVTALEANSGTSASAVQKTGDTMTGALTINGAGLTVTGADVYVDGNITATGEVTGLSDVSLKYNIRTIENALDKVDMMRGTLFNRADIKGNPEQLGVIAQEMQEVMPQVVHEQPNGLLSVAYANLSALLIEAIKELRAEVNDLKARLS